jgi:hypothetical protein
MLVLRYGRASIPKSPNNGESLGAYPRQQSPKAYRLPRSVCAQHEAMLYHLHQLKNGDESATARRSISSHDIMRAFVAS